MQRTDTRNTETDKVVPGSTELPTLGQQPTSDHPVERSQGVAKIEALYHVFGNGWKIWLLYASIGLITYIYSLSGNTTSTYLAFATSSYGKHTALGTISVINTVMASVAKPFIAKIADYTSRPVALLLAVSLYCLGYTAVAASHRVADVGAGEVFYTLGNTGIQFLKQLLVSDITSLKWRGLAQALNQSPPIINAFVAGYISSGISAFSQNGWRWGYGMFIILVPVTIAPAIIILFWADRRAQKLGLISISAPKIVADEHPVGRGYIAKLIRGARQLDAIGLGLLGTSLALILVPFTLARTADGGYHNPSIIAMLVVGGVLFLTFCGWELRIASHPIMPRRVFNRTLLCCMLIDHFYFLSNFLQTIYFSSYIYVVKDWSDRNYQFFNNTETVALAVFAFIPGTYQRVFHRYKHMQIVGLGIRTLGCGLLYYSTINRSDAVVIIGQIIAPLGGIMSAVASQTACEASVPHNDMALALALLGIWTSIGGSIGGAIAAAVWNSVLPNKLQYYLGSSFSSDDIDDIFGSITVARKTQPRDKVIDAYCDTMRHLLLGSLVVSFAPFIVSFFTSNFYLGDTQNAVDDTVIMLKPARETAEQAVREKVAQEHTQ